MAAFADRVLVLHEGGWWPTARRPRFWPRPPCRYGLEPTRYTQAARRPEAGFRPQHPDLPVTLEQAVEFFR